MATDLAVWWRLVYRDGSAVTEPFDRASIRLAPRNAAALQLLTSLAAYESAAVVHVPIGPGERPIFYRRRSMAIHPIGDIRDDAVVYGVAREDKTELWCVIPGLLGYRHSVPESWIDMVAIRGLVEG